MPQRDFARKIGVAQSTIMRIENLDQNVTLDTLESLCKVFHADVADLFPRLDTRRDYATRPPVGLIRPGQGSALPVIHEAEAGTGPTGGKRVTPGSLAGTGKTRRAPRSKGSPSGDDPR